MNQAERLQAILCGLLAISGTLISVSAASARWMDHHQPDALSLKRMLPLVERMNLGSSKYYLRLADLEPELEEFWLRRSLVADPRQLPALLRLSLIEEFRGRKAEARALVDQAMHFHRSFESYMAGLTQAARWSDRGRVQKLAEIALKYCPRDADGVYAQLGDLAISKPVLMKQDERRRVDYLRFLIGQKRLSDAFAYQGSLEPSEKTYRLQLELCEALLWSGRQAQAAELFSRLHPDFQRDGFYNLDFHAQPDSLGFDWRLSQHPSAKISWRPGSLEVQMKPLTNANELVSLMVESRDRKITQVIPDWHGELNGLSWTVQDAGPRLQRIALVAEPAQERRFQIHGVRFQ